MADEPDEPTDRSDEQRGDNGDNGGDSTDDQDLVDRDKIDFDPDDGLYSGTAVDGSTDIPGPHEGDQTDD